MFRSIDSIVNGEIHPKKKGLTWKHANIQLGDKGVEDKHSHRFSNTHSCAIQGLLLPYLGLLSAVLNEKLHIFVFTR